MSELTKEERKWLSGVQRALNKSGSGRIGFYATGDTDLFIYNNELEDEIDAFQDTGTHDMGHCVETLDASFGEGLKFPSHVHSCAG